MSPLFSIIIPTLNEEKFLPNLLKDLEKQKDTDFEVIVADGKSEDKTEKLALGFKKKFSIQVITCEKRHVSCQRNLGAKAAVGKYLIFIDADSRIPANFLSKLRQHIEKYNYLLMVPSAEPFAGSYHDRIIFKLLNYAVELSHGLGKPFSTGGTCIIEKNLFNHLNGFNEQLFMSEDHEIVQHAKKIGVASKYLENVKMKFSLRRIEKDGLFDVAGKYTVAFMHTLTKGGVDQKIFEYEMGGSRYADVKKSSKTTLKLRKIFQQFKKQVEDALTLTD